MVAVVVVGLNAGPLSSGVVGVISAPSVEASGSSSIAVVPSATPTDTPLATPVPTPSPSPTPVPTPVLIPAPLTGLLVTESAALQYPIAVMVDDHKAARPQSGFNAAAQVWQAPAEGGIPRYMMLFQDSLPSSVGPIRSARQYYIEWASEWRALYVHVGGSPQAMTTLRKSGRGQLVYNADGLRFDGTRMWRVKDRAAPHNVYTDADNLLQMGAAVGATNQRPEPAWTFGSATALDERPSGTTIVVKYPYETITYRYDTLSNTYRRFIDGSKTQQVDRADDRPVAPTNVVILRIRFGPLNDGHPEKNRLEAQNVGAGEAIISSNGRVIQGTWKKAAADAPTLLFGPDGRPVTLAAGQTFVQVIALSYEYSIVEGVAPTTGIDAR